MSALNWGGWPSVQGAAVDSQGELQAKIHLTATTIDGLSTECDAVAAGFTDNEAEFAKIAAAQAATAASLQASTTDVRVAYTAGAYPGIYANQGFTNVPLPFGNDAGSFLVYATFSLEGSNAETFSVLFQLKVNGNFVAYQAFSNASRQSPAYYYWSAAYANPQGDEVLFSLRIDSASSVTVNDLTVGQLKF